MFSPLIVETRRPFRRLDFIVASTFLFCVSSRRSDLLNAIIVLPLARGIFDLIFSMSSKFSMT